MYEVEAYTYLNRVEKGYDAVHDLAGIVDYGESGTVECYGGVTGRGNYFERMAQFNNLGYNLSVLHSKDNKIP